MNILGSAPCVGKNPFRNAIFGRASFGAVKSTPLADCTGIHNRHFNDGGRPPALARNCLQVRAMIMAGSGRGVDGRCSERRIDRWESTPNRWLSEAIELFPVLSETGAETGDDPLHSPASVGDRCRPGRLTLRAGGEPFDLVLAKTDGCVETSGFGGNVVQPAPAGVGVAPGPGGGLFGPRPPGPPVQAGLSLARRPPPRPGAWWSCQRRPRPRPVPPPVPRYRFLRRRPAARPTAGRR
jgi:hypothetical protein